MDWNAEIKAWENRTAEKYSKYDSEGYQTQNWPEQDITIEYNCKTLIHVNGDYKPGCIKKVMAKTFTGKGKKRIEVEEIES